MRCTLYSMPFFTIPTFFNCKMLMFWLFFQSYQSFSMSAYLSPLGASPGKYMHMHCTCLDILGTQKNAVCAYAPNHRESGDQLGLGYALTNKKENRNLCRCALLAGSSAAAGINKSPQRKVDTAAPISTADEYPGLSAS